jgi:hypothetical protein
MVVRKEMVLFTWVVVVQCKGIQNIPNFEDSLGYSTRTRCLG